jgi:hypothetical protein
MPILNYTTKIAPEKTAIEIQKKLVSAGARGIMTQFDENGVMIGITFQIDGPLGPLYYNLPANIDKVYVVLQNSGIERRYRNREQASRVAWRIIKDWIEAQIALVETEMVEMAEVFLPYMQTDNGETVYRRLENNNFLLTHD